MTHLKLKETKDKLREEIATKNTFFSIISHDLRGSLGLITGIVEIVKDNKDSLTKEEIDEFLVDIDNTTKKTTDLLGNLLNWARSQTGNINYIPIKLNLDKLIQDLLISNKEAANKKSIHLEFTNEGESILAYADKNMVSLVLRNLLSNALKFTPKNGKIEVAADYVKNFIRISVSDTGVGMTEEKIKKLFNVTQKVSTQGTENEQGNGLGLILCKEFVLLNNGEIGVESEVDKGTTVWFTLPVFQD